MDSTFFLGARTLIDVNSKIRKLYYNKKYYFSFNRKVNKKNYWSLKKDPDGKIRDRLKNHKKEKSLFIQNNISLIKQIYKLKVKNFIDVGCGPGYLLSNFQNIMDVYGIEKDTNAIKIAERYGKIFNFDLDKPFEIKKKFDLVVCYHLIEHIKKPENLIKNLKKIIKPKKYIIIGTPDFDCYMARKFKNKFRLLNDLTHVSLFSLDSILRFLRDFNFEIVNVDFPFENTKYFTRKSFKKAFCKVSKDNLVSPPFYGNFITITAKIK